MNLKILLLTFLIFSSFPSFAKISLEDCIEEAEKQYPLIKKYDLISKNNTLQLEEINRQWLPNVSVYAQGSVQNNVPEFPNALTDIMAQMGRQMKGLSHLQYKLGIDVSQTVWDGGISAAKRKESRAAKDESDAALAVSLYAVREKVISLYFGALLIDQQIKQQEVTINLLKANHQKIEAMVRNGTAMQCDADNIEAQILSVSQQVTEARSSLESYIAMLSLFVGRTILADEIFKPTPNHPDLQTNNRPELHLFETQIARNNAKKSGIESSLMPKISVFMQSFYGYPGFNNFEAMMNRNLSFNILGGLKIQWSISPLYTKNISMKKIGLANENIMAERETFLFNTSLETVGESEEIKTVRQLIESDGEIIRLREAVRKAAEVQLDNGVIDAVALLSKITDETQSRLNADYHEIKLLQSIYNLKFTLNQ